MNTQQRHEILFIDANVSDPKSLIDGLSSDIEIVLLDDKTNVLNQITAILDGYQNLDAIHIISHGAEGELAFANGVLNNANVNDYVSQLKRIGSALSEYGDLLLYGCNVAKGDDGLAFINTLADLTGADVAASDDLTGSNTKDSDWVLEKFLGKIDSRIYTNDKYKSTLSSIEGIVTTDFNSASDHAFDIFAQPDGKILAVGYSTVNSKNFLTYYFSLVRYNSNGSLDTSFDSDGKVLTELGGRYNYVKSVALQSDGKILVVGYSSDVSNDYNFSLVRYNSNGSLDTSFDSDGKVVTHFTGNSGGESVTVQPDGKILVAGIVWSNGVYNFSLVRYNSNGSLDTSFDSDGKVITEFGGGTNVRSLTLQSDGKILVVGSVTDVNNGYNFALARYNSNGSLDTSFDFDGKVVTDVDWEDRPANVTVQVDGKILVAGVSSPDSRTVVVSLVRYNSNGNLDTSFGLNGKVTTSIGNRSSSLWVSSSIQSDGKILVGTSYYIDSNKNNFVLVRYNSDGSLDSSFDNDGKVAAYFGGVFNEIRSISVQKDGKILVAGDTLGNELVNSDFILARFNSDGSIDTSFRSENFSSNIQIPPTGTVSISGTSQQYQTLYASNTLADLNGLSTITYQWLSNGNVISGANQNTYTLTQAEVGKTITVTASYTDGLGKLESMTSSLTYSVANVNDLPIGSITITGTAKTGQTLTASNNLSDADGLGSMSYQWLRSGYIISGANQSSYILTSNDVNSTISVKASYTDGFGAQEAVTSSATAIITSSNNAPTGYATASLTSGLKNTTYTVYAANLLQGFSDADGDVLTVTNLSATNASISNNGNNTWTLTPNTNYVGTISLNYSVTDSKSIPIAASQSLSVIQNQVPPTGTVNISGTTQQYQTLYVNNALADANGLGTINYQWLSNGNVMSGANQNFYTLTQAEVGKTITVTASYIDGLGKLESMTSSATNSVTNVNDLPKGSVYINGKPNQAQVLTASNDISDLDGLGAINYQWLRSGSLINGANQSSYTLTANDVNSSISVKASYTDSYGTTESVTSSSITAQPPAQTPPTGSVIINGASQQNQTLTVSQSLADINGLGPINYEWLRNDNIISGATQISYTLTQADVGKAITVRTSYTDGLGKLESVTSSPTSPVVNVNDLSTGSVTISGEAKQGRIFTASNNIADADGLGTISYQWLRNGEIISNANNSSYTLTQADANQSLSVKASYMDGQGTREYSGPRKTDR